MNVSSTIRFLVGMIVAIAVPGIACFGFYTQNDVESKGGYGSTLAILVYPLILIGLIMLVTTYFSARRTPFRLIISVVCLAVPLLFLLLVKLF